MRNAHSGNGTRFGTQRTRGWRRRASELIGSVANVVIGPTEIEAQRQDIVRRALVAGVIIAVLPIQSLRIPGWQAVMAACGLAIFYDIPLAYLVFVRNRASAARVLGLVLDALLLMGASLVVLREIGAGGSASDIWLVFVVYIIIGGFTLAPAGSLIYTALWTGWLALATLLYFPDGSQYRDELPVRLVFLGLIGLVSLGMALELERRRRRLEVQNRQTMAMLAALVEARDTDAGAHLHHIQHFSRALALHVGLAESEAQEIAYASLVHDVGKANVPDAILKKPGPLTSQERIVIQEHTKMGDDLLAENSDFAMARQVARSHHEHWDGSGYPDGLKGEEIPRSARIVAVADVYDALISVRPYKEAWTSDAAIRELRRIAGAHLDEALVGAFVELWEWGVIERITQEILAEDEARNEPISQAA